MKKVNLVLSSVLVLSFMGACTSNVKKADIPSTANPQAEITKLETELNSATASNIDILAATDFNKSIDFWKKAKKDLVIDNFKQN